MRESFVLYESARLDDYHFLPFFFFVFVVVVVCLLLLLGGGEGGGLYWIEKRSCRGCLLKHLESSGLKL